MDDTNKDTDTPSLVTDKWIVTREDEKVHFQPADRRLKKELFTKTYGSKHAAVCALGRIRHDYSIADKIVANVKVEQLKGPKVKKEQSPKVIRTDRLLSIAMEELAEANATTVEEVQKSLFKTCQKRVANGTPFQGLNDMRYAIGEANDKMHKKGQK